MRCPLSQLCRETSVFLWNLFSVFCLSSAIMVPTGKLAPIQSAEPSELPAVPSQFQRPSAPVKEYSNENPEPAPLAPSFVPPQFDYIQYLTPHAIGYVPMRLKNPYSVHSNKVPEYKEKDNNYSINIKHNDNNINNSNNNNNNNKYNKYSKLTKTLLSKYEDYPAHLQKKYLHYYLTTE